MPDVIEVSPHVVIERMTEHDLLEVVELEQAAGLSYWGWDAYHAELQSRFDSLMLVARERGQGQPARPAVIGFLVGRCLAGEVHVNNVAVRPEFRRQGIGQNLLRALLDWGKSKQATQAVLEVRAGNSAAQALYRASGFQVAGRRRRYYRDPLEDALLMTVSLNEEP